MTIGSQVICISSELFNLNYLLNITCTVVIASLFVGVLEIVEMYRNLFLKLNLSKVREKET